MPSGLEYYIIDVETSGLSCQYHEITQISLIRFSDRYQLVRNIKCDNPNQFQWSALRVTNRKPADLLKGGTKEEAIQACEDFLNQDGKTPAHRVFVGHKVLALDKRFCHALWAKINKELPVDNWLDTHSLMKKYTNSIGLVKPKLTLNASLEIVGIKPKEGAHDAKIDTQNNYFLFDKIQKLNIDILPFIKVDKHTL